MKNSVSWEERNIREKSIIIIYIKIILSEKYKFNFEEEQRSILKNPPKVLLQEKKMSDSLNCPWRGIIKN